MRVLVTGASGFAGRPLVDYLVKEGYSVRAAVRNLDAAPPGALETVLMPDMSKPFVARPLVQDCEAVVHVAGLAHSTGDISDSVYYAVNTYAAQSLALASRDASVKVFVYISSVRAQTGPYAHQVLTETNEPAPSDLYGRSKLEGEKEVAAALRGTGTAFVVLRPVLMYGPNAKGNMATLMRLARTNYALPLGGLKARRSVLGIENFSSAVSHVLRQSRCDGQTFLLADSAPLTVGEIVAGLRRGLNKPPRILNIPLRGAGKVMSLMGKRDFALRLFNDLVVSTDAIAATGWQPPLSTPAGLAAAING